MGRKLTGACSDAETSRPNAPIRLSKRLVPLSQSSVAATLVATASVATALVATEEVSTKLQLMERCELLEETLEASNQQLKATQEDQQRTTKVVQEFVNAVSHDLQAPLRAISGFSQFLREEYQEQLDGTANGYIDRVVDGAAKMEQLINVLVMYSRVTTKVAPFEMVSLEAIVDEVLGKLRSQIYEVGAVITADPLPVVFGDHAQLTLLIQNLIDNSLKFRSSSKTAIHITAEQTRQNWTIGIKDNGIGISKEHQESVFKIFRRLHAQQKYQGVGAGLAICRRIADRHLGKIWLHSEDDGGCTFYFTIPLAST